MNDPIYSWRSLEEEHQYHPVFCAAWGLGELSPTELQLQAAASTTGQVGKKVFKNGKKNKTNAKNKWQYDKL